MTTYFMSAEVLARAVDQWQESAILGPQVTERLAWLDSMDTSEVSSMSILEALRQPQAAQSLKGAMLPASESLGRYGSPAPAAMAIQPKQTEPGQPLSEPVARAVDLVTEAFRTLAARSGTQEPL